MSKYDLSAVHVLNKFLWDNLVAEGLMQPVNYNGLVPIIPTQQEPVFSDMASGKPFIVYTYMRGSSDPGLYSKVEQVTYLTYSDDESKLRRITHFISDLCDRFDWSAQDVNDWLDNNTTMPVDSDDRKFEFKYIQVVGVTGVEPINQEGGRQSGSVTVRMAYTHDVNPEVAGTRLGMRA